MMRSILTILALVVVGAVSRAEPMENPEFASWSKFKPGTSLTMKTVSQLKDIKSEVKVTTKLVEVGAEKLVLEMESISVLNGMEFKAPAMKRDVPKTVDVPKTPEQAVAKPGKPEGTTEEGTETVKVSGTEVKTKWFKYKSKANGVEVDGQTWTSDEIPGGMVKMLTNAGETKMTMEVVEFKKP
jgi:hypothetical protein